MNACDDDDFSFSIFFLSSLLVYERDRTEQEFDDEEQRVVVTTVSYALPTLENDEAFDTNPV